jgi:hypothetical protein
MVPTRGLAIVGPFIGRSTRPSGSKVYTWQVALCTACTDWLVLRTADLAMVVSAHRASVETNFGRTFAAEHGSQLSRSLRGLVLRKPCVEWECAEVANIALYAKLKLQVCVSSVAIKAWSWRLCNKVIA